MFIEVQLKQSCTCEGNQPFFKIIISNIKQLSMKMTTFKRIELIITLYTCAPISKLPLNINIKLFLSRQIV